MSEWTKVVTEPLGLAGFALFLVFGMLSRVKAARERQILSYIAMGMAVISLTAGLGLAGLRVLRETSTAPAQNRQTGQSPPVQQHTEGAGSPAVNDVTGNVTITVDQSSGIKPKKAPEHKPEQSGSQPANQPPKTAP